MAKQINFLRGVPADESLVPIVEAFAAEYPKVFSDYGKGVLQYQTPGLADFNGFVPLKKTLAERLEVEGDPQSRVLCSNGGMETVSLLLKSLPDRSPVATEALTYDRVLIDLARHGCQIRGVPLSDDGVDLGALEEVISESGMQFFYQVAYHQSPTGITTTVENMRKASEICASRGVLHVLDIAYFELRYDGSENSIIDLTEFPETTCLVGSFTKTLSPGAKCGFGIFPPKVLDAMTPVVANTRLNPNYPTQAVIHSLMSSGFYDEHLRFLRDLYRPRMEAMNLALEKAFPEVSFPTLTGGFFFGLWLPGIRDEESFVEALKPKGVVLSPPQVFAPGWRERTHEERGGVFFRLTFPAFSPEDNRLGIERIAETYRELT